MTTAGDALKLQISTGILAFPATPFGPTGGPDRNALARHIADLVPFRPSALVAAGGAGELFSLSLAEHAATIDVAVAEASSIPVIAGVGQGVGTAVEMAAAAERAGASAVLIFPPYLINSEQVGLRAYVEQICRSVSIGAIVYSRDNGIVSPDTALRLADSCPNLIALKDGTGDFETLVSLKQRVGDRVALINGVPTAEIVARQCFAMGITSYTSAVFTFLPRVGGHFFKAVRDGNDAVVDRLLGDFYVPLCALRSRKRGYAVSIVKAGLRIAGRPAGPVRPPLVDLEPAEERELAALMERATEIVTADEHHPIGISPASAIG